MAQMDSDALRMQLAQLRQEHRDLDVAVEALAATSNHDVLQLQRLKKKKLSKSERDGFVNCSLKSPMSLLGRMLRPAAVLRRHLSKSCDNLLVP